MERAAKSMKVLLETRWLLLKHKFWRTLLWLLLPLVLTCLFTVLFNKTSDDFRIPVAIIQESEAGDIQTNVIETLRNSEYIDVNVYSDDAVRRVLHDLDQNDFDSVFIIKSDFEEQVAEGSRRNLIESYYTGQSLFYEPTKEVIASVIQEKFGEMYAVDHVLRLQEEYSGNMIFDESDVIEQISETEDDTNLVTQHFHFAGAGAEHVQETLNPLNIWSYLTILFTIFLFDFIVVERKNSVSERFLFMKWTHEQYLLLNVFLFTVVMIAVDCLSFAIYASMFDVAIELLPLLCFRMVVNVMAFLLAIVSNKAASLYQRGLLLVCVLIAGQILLPFVQSSLLRQLHPVDVYLNGGLNILCLGIFSVLLVIWKVRRT
jgi:hypothetical protein